MPSETNDLVSDGISDLLGQMTLQCSSTTQPPKLLHTISNTDEPVLTILDTPVNHKQQQKSEKDNSSLCDGPSTPLSRADSAASASPSVSSVIEALHLSDIDWDAPSFTSSPQSATNHGTEPQLSKTAGTEVREMKNLELKTSAAEVSYTECPLRDRVLIRNTAKAIDQMEVHNDGVSKQLHCELASLAHVLSDSNSISNGQIPCKSGSDDKFTRHIKEALADKRQNATDKTKAETQRSKQQLRPKARPPNTTKDLYNNSEKPHQKYAFDRTVTSSSIIPQQRHHSDPGQSRKTRPQTTKKSVCMNVASSSEESDTENQFCLQRKAKTKFKDYFPKTTEVIPKTAQTVQLLPVKPRSCSVDADINSMPVSPTGICQDVSPANEIDDVFPNHPPSPVIVIDSDSSAICSESPLPLAERLRLKFLK